MKRAFSIAVFLAGLLSIQAVAQCDKQIAQLRETWVEDWNAKNLDGVMTLYAPDATLLPSDGSRDTGQSEIRAVLEKQIGSKVSVQSVKIDCSGDLGYESGSYKQDLVGMQITGGIQITGGTQITGGGAKHIEGQYLVVLKHESGKWLIAQHASTAKP